MNSIAVRIVRLLMVILSLVILGSGPRVRGSETVGKWNFSRLDDLNFDDVPDGWKRVDAPGYPRYLTFAIRAIDVERAERMRAADARVLEEWQKARSYAPWLPPLPPSLADLLVNRYLRAEVDGGALQMISPRIEVFNDYSYRLRLRMRSEGLKHNQAWAEIVFYNAAGQVLQTVESKRLGGTADWTEIEVGPLSPPPTAVAADIRLRVEPDQKPDMTGAAGFDDIRIERLPRIRTESDQPRGIYAPGAQPRIRCIVSGLPSPVASIQFSLRDEADREIATQILALTSDPAAGRAPPPGGSRSATTAGYGGVAEWQLPSLDPGFYRVKVHLIGRPAEEFDIEQTIAVLADLPSGGGPFGWALSGHPLPEIPPRSLPDWLDRCRVSWVKYPCWVRPDDLAAIDDLNRLFRRFRERGIETVGVLANPPPETLARLGARASDPAAILFRDDSGWRPLLEPVMARLTPEVRWWQLGGERDYSFLGRSQLTQLIADIRTGLEGFGHPVRLVLSWPWLDALPPESSRSWDAVCLSDSLQPTATEINAYFAPPEGSSEATPLDGGPGERPLAGSSVAASDQPISNRPWILLDPLPVDRYRRSDRIRDLILRMLAVREQQIPAAFVSDPFDPTLGLLRTDGTPDEMLLPWRTASALLGPLRPVGSLELPGGSRNVVLMNDTRVVMVVWSDSPQTETLYLGEEVSQIDVWGRTQPAEQVTVRGRPRQRIDVGPLPTFVVGVDRIAALWRMHVHLEPQRLDSLLGREQTVQMQFQNPSARLLSGSYRIRAPEAWNVGRFSQPIMAEPHLEQSEPLSLVLRSDATIGRHRVAIDFDLDGDRQRRFTVWRYLQIGPEDVHIEVTTRLLPDGRLRVRQELSVTSETPQRFDCYVYAPGRKRQRRGITVPADGTVRQEFYIDNGAELIGHEMLLRADQRESGRLLNYRFTARR